MSPVHIYGLVDPRTLHIRYIGKTNDIEKRYASHIRVWSYSNNAGRNLVEWLRELKYAGHRPELQILETVESEGLLEEIRWIAEYAHKSPGLLNVRPGGQKGRIAKKKSYSDQRTLDQIMHALSDLTGEPHELGDIFKWLPDPIPAPPSRGEGEGEGEGAK